MARLDYTPYGGSREQSISDQLLAGSGLGPHPSSSCVLLTGTCVAELAPSVTIQNDGLLILKPLPPFAKSLFTNKVVFTGIRE